MPRYFFHVDDGVAQLDLDGTDLPTPEHARMEAVRLAGAIFKEEAQRVVAAAAWHMEVTDHTGATLLRLSFTLAEAPPGMLVTRNRRATQLID